VCGELDEAAGKIRHANRSREWAAWEQEIARFAEHLCQLHEGLHYFGLNQFRGDMPFGGLLVPVLQGSRGSQ
jgi:hypothetical protein